MLTEEHDEAENQRRVWLDESEVDRLLELPEEQKHRIAIALGARGGLRSHEIVDVAPSHVIDTDAGVMLKVPEGKGEKYRETPIPDTLAASIRSIGDYRDRPKTEPVIDNATRTLRNWIEKYREILREETGDDRWQYFSSHDLRRTWAGQLSNSDVDQQVAQRWGGWDDLQVFLDHYRGEATAAAQLRERQKVEWL